MVKHSGVVGHSDGQVGHSVGQVVTDSVVTGQSGQLLLLLVPAGQTNRTMPYF